MNPVIPTTSLGGEEKFFRPPELTNKDMTKPFELEDPQGCFARPYSIRVITYLEPFEIGIGSLKNDKKRHF